MSSGTSKKCQKTARLTLIKRLSHRNIVTTKIIPALLKVIDPETYPIGEGILYEMIHQRHRHQREEVLRKRRQQMHKLKKVCVGIKILAKKK